MGGHVDGFYAMSMISFSSPSPFAADEKETEAIQRALGAALRKLTFRTATGVHRVREANVFLVGATLTATRRAVARGLTTSPPRRPRARRKA